MRQARAARTMDGLRAAARKSGRRRQSPRGLPPATFLCDPAEEVSSGEKGFGEPLVRVDAGSELIDFDVFVWRVRDVNRAGAKEKRLAPVVQQGNVGSVGNGTCFEARHRR